MTCPYCANNLSKVFSLRNFHPFQKSFGPFDFHKCKICKSGFTFPMPLPEEINCLYQTFKGGMIPATRKIRDKNPLAIWHEKCVDRAIKYNQNLTTDFHWLDLGAGNGEVAFIMAKKYPDSHGYAIDFHDKPHLLKNVKNITWIKYDLNEGRLLELLNKQFDIIISITVIEHILYPDDFLTNACSLLKKKGSFYLTSPDFGSISAKIFNKYWPYLIYGEHLTIPTKTGLRRLIKRIRKDLNATVKPVILPYPITYYLDSFGLTKISKFINRTWILPFNTGILEANITNKF